MRFSFLVIVALLTTPSLQQRCPVRSRPARSTESSRCGIRQQSQKTELIVHGATTRPGDWPWHAALYQRQGRSDVYVCGGTLISEQFVLTAAHCVINPRNRYQLAAQLLSVRLGVYDLDQLELERLQQHSVAGIRRFVGSALQVRLKNDIALLELKERVVFTAYVQPACVDQREVVAGEVGTAVGWGYTEDERVSSVLKAARLPIIGDLECLDSNRDVFGLVLDSGTFCAGYRNGTSVCNGDSGGGLFVMRGDAWYLVGIVSFTESSEFSNRCKSDSYGVFTRVFKYLPWIKAETSSVVAATERVDTSQKQESADYSRHFPRNCGVYTVNRIAWGQRAQVFEFPWVVVIKMMFNGKTGMCMGTLVNKRYVLTTAGCVLEAFIVEIVLGEHTFNRDPDCDPNVPSYCAPPARKYGVECFTSHPNFNYPHNDIALIRLNRDVAFEDHIQAICLPVTQQLRNLQPPEYIVTGWIEEDRTIVNNSLHKARIRAVDPEDCSKLYSQRSDLRIVLTDRLLCAEGSERDKRHGVCFAAGQPIGSTVQTGTGVRFVHFGIWSTGPRNCVDFPGIYTKVGAYMEWIVANVET